MLHWAQNWPTLQSKLMGCHFPIRNILSGSQLHFFPSKKSNFSLEKNSERVFQNMSGSNSRKFWKTHSKVFLQSKKNRKTHSEVFFFKGKKGHPRGKKIMGGPERIFFKYV
jgi:hypothetical protein